MGKRRSVVVLSSSPSSSDKEDARRSAASRRRSSASSSATSSSRKKKPRRRSSSIKDDSRKHEFDMLSEEFSECLNPLSHQKELWVDKYKPESLSDLAVPKKKVGDVKNWLEERLNTPKDQGFGNYTLLITGQAGVGKFTVIQVLAKQLKFELCEWKTPTPTLWSEHLHNTYSGLRYMSKLEEFETFIEKITKYSSLITSINSKKPFVILIDDIPLTNGQTGLNRLSKCLTGLTRLTRFPTIILLTQCQKSEFNNDGSNWYWEDLESLLEKAGAHKIVFNPITINSMKKTLLKITKQEKYSEISAETIENISKSSGGDIRNAITSLQYFCLNPEQNLLISGQENGPHSFGRDETLSLFHALGKFLHNKRELNTDSELGDPHGFSLKDKYKRNKLKMESPEIILTQSNSQSRSITDFLNENILDFIDSGAVSDAWVISSYLSDSDYLISGSLGMSAKRAIGGIDEFEGLNCIIAASVSVRGVLFGNSQPAPSRWHAIRSPKIWQVEQAMRHTKDGMLKERFENLETCFSSLNLSDIATDFRPFINRVGSDYLASVSNMNKMQIQYPVNKSNPLETADSDEASEDDIQDW